MVELDKEAAEAEFERWVELCDFDLDPQYMSQEAKEDLALRKRVVIRHLERGMIAIDEEGNLEYQLKLPVKNVSSVTFPVDPKGDAVLAADTSKAGRDVAKMYAMVQALTGTPGGFMAAAARRDREVILAVANFLS